MTTSLTPPPVPEKPWLWTSLGTAAMIVVCCGIAPVAIIAGIEAARDKGKAGKGDAVVAQSSHRPPSLGASPEANTGPNPKSPAASPGPKAPQSPAANPPQLALPPFDPPSGGGDWAEGPAMDSPGTGQPAYEEPSREEPSYEEPSYDEPSAGSDEEPADAQRDREVTLPQPPEIARIGQTTSFGGLEFVVREVRCGLKWVGDEIHGQHTRGQFCQVSISVRNIGQVTQSLLDSAQKAIDANGYEYGIHSLACAAANDTDHQNWLSGIDPGEEVSGFTVFELPEGVGLAQVELPGGVRVSAG